MTLCAVCTMHMETRSASFLIEPQNQGRRFVNGLASKPLGWFVSGLASKPLGRFVSGLTSKSLGRFVSGLASKPLGWFSPVWPQNWWRRWWVSWLSLITKVVEGFRFGPQNRQL
jgi:hypothetical protein